ncbi:hypothetical protein D3C84_547680 [compost metagenome]
MHQAGSGLTVILNQNAASARVTHVEHQIYRDRFDGIGFSVSDDAELRDLDPWRLLALLIGDRLGQQGEQIEVMRNRVLLLYLALPLLSIAPLARIIKDLKQPLF